MPFVMKSSADDLAKRYEPRNLKDPFGREKDKHEKVLGEAALAFFRQQLERVKKKASTLKKDAGDDFDDDFWLQEDDILQGEFSSSLADVATDAVGLDAHRLLSKFRLGLDRGLLNKLAVEWAEKYSSSLITKINENTRTLTRKAIADWMGEPELTFDDLVERLTDLYDDEDRAELIGITETTASFANGERITTEELKSRYPDIEIVRKRYTNRDSVVCDFCFSPTGFVVIEDEEDEAPVHPGCRCHTGRSINGIDD